MKKLSIMLMLFMLTFSCAWCQDYKTDSIAKSEIKKLAFLEGSWAGKGWMMGRDGKKQTFEQTELVSFKLDSTALLVEGNGTSNGNPIHRALAIISFDKGNNKYNFRSYLADREGGSFSGELIENKFYWYPNEKTRFIIYQNDSGQWYETGEFSRNDSWSQFFEMTLDKQ